MEMGNANQLNDNWRQITLRVVCAITAMLFAWWVYSFAVPAYYEGILFLSRRILVKFILGIGASIGFLVILGISFTDQRNRIYKGLDRGEIWLRRFTGYNLVFFMLLVAGVSIFLMMPSGLIYRDKASRLLFFWVTALMGSFFLLAAGISRRWIVLLGSSAIFTAFGFRVAAYLPDVSIYPFTLSWSEASRYYYASLYFAKQLYGESIPWTILHPTRYLMQAVPFLIPHSSLWFHRLWQVLLWIFTTLGFSAAFIHRLSIKNRFMQFAVAAWVFLFMLVGPVYYHLQVPAILMIWGFHPTRTDRRSRIITNGVLILASVWAGISRVNWYPMPGLLAAILYFIEINQQGKPIWRYLFPPIIWTIGGLAVATTSQATYIWLSGNPADQFASSFTSNLLWYRLFPNSTYPLGILGAAIFISLPLILLAGIKLGGKWRRVHFMRFAGIFAILLILFTGGLVVSVKIGGGSNLHNMDAFMTALLLTCALIYFDKLSLDNNSIQELQPVEIPRNYFRHFHSVWMAYAILAPIAFTVFSGGALTYPSQEDIDTNLQKIRRLVQRYGAEGEVLFISERQLLTFGEIQGVKLIPDYERVFLMEMAMSGNKEYLEQFRQDLKNQRFAMIVSEPLFLPVKDESERFGEENNAWVNYVGKNLRCYYTAIKTVKELKVQLLIPQTKINKKCE